MSRYTKPSIKIKTVKINSFLGNDNLRSPLSNFSSFFAAPPVFATNHTGGGGSIQPPGTGDGGLLDGTYPGDGTGYGYDSTGYDGTGYGGIQPPSTGDGGLQ